MNETALPSEECTELPKDRPFLFQPLVASSRSWRSSFIFWTIAFDEAILSARDKESHKAGVKKTSESTDVPDGAEDALWSVVAPEVAAKVAGRGPGGPPSTTLDELVRPRCGDCS